METIRHRVEIEGKKEHIYQALTEPNVLSLWWTKAVVEQELIRFYFGPAGEHCIVMQQVECIENTTVVWRCVEGPWQDIGQFIFAISQENGKSVLKFSHDGWPQANDFFQHCNSKWGFFLVVSLKQFIETGQGLPHPSDPNI